MKDYNSGFLISTKGLLFVMQTNFGKEICLMNFSHLFKYALVKWLVILVKLYLSMTIYEH